MALCFDESFCVLAAATLASLIRHASPGHSYHIYIIHSDLSAGSRRALAALAPAGGRRRVTIEFVPFSAGGRSCRGCCTWTAIC